jgi:hypothetical protein
VLYKVTPMMPAQNAESTQTRKKREPGEPRKRRKSAVYDHEGHEVLVTLMCLKCKNIKPLGQFGLRKMGDGAIRNQPWCRTCRSGAGAKKPASSEIQAPVQASVPAEAVEVEAFSEASESELDPVPSLSESAEHAT